MDLDDIAVFVKVVQAGSFSKAARLLGMPNTTVSAKVARLEKRLGVTLIRRTTRKLHVTSAGQAYFERCMRGLAEIETAEAELSSSSVEPRGVLRITAPGDVAHGLLPPIAARYVEAYPHASLEIIVTNRVVDLVGEGVDLAIRAARLKDSTLVARKWLSFTGGLWASREYLSRRGTPKAPVDLESHEYLILSRVARDALRLSDGHRKIEVSLKGRMVTDDLDTVLALARQGSGIAGLPDFLARRYADDGTLVGVLPQWSWITGSLSFVYPSQPFLPAKVRAFIDLALASSRHA
ncbi:MAG: LysR substrate-binding domain-containing protein [Burkholderiales bacterium]